MEDIIRAWERSGSCGRRATASPAGSTSARSSGPDPGLGRLLPPVPGPARRLVRAAPGPADALPGGGRNRLPRIDERAEGHVGRGHGADPRAVRDQRLRRARTAAGVARRRAAVPPEEGGVRRAARRRAPLAPRTLFEPSGEPGDTTLLAHNEHWLAGDVGNIAVIVDKPDDGRVPVASPTIVCCLPAVGMNAHGGAQGIGSLTAVRRRRGGPAGAGVAELPRGAGPRATRSRGRPCPGGRGATATCTRSAAATRSPWRPPARSTGARPRRAAHEPLPERPRRTRAARHRRAARRGWRDCRRCSTSAAADPGRPDGHHARPRFEPAGHLPASGTRRGRRGVGGDVLDGGRRRRRRMWVAPGNPCESEYVEIDLADLAT